MAGYLTTATPLSSVAASCGPTPDRLSSASHHPCPCDDRRAQGVTFAFATGSPSASTTRTRTSSHSCCTPSTTGSASVSASAFTVATAIGFPSPFPPSAPGAARCGHVISMAKAAKATPSTRFMLPPRKDSLPPLPQRVRRARVLGQGLDRGGWMGHSPCRPASPPYPGAQWPQPCPPARASRPGGWPPPDNPSPVPVDGLSWSLAAPHGSRRSPPASSPPGPGSDDGVA